MGQIPDKIRQSRFSCRYIFLYPAPLLSLHQHHCAGDSQFDGFPMHWCRDMCQQHLLIIIWKPVSVLTSNLPLLNKKQIHQMMLYILTAIQEDKQLQHTTHIPVRGRRAYEINRHMWMTATTRTLLSSPSGYIWESVRLNASL